MDLKTLQDEWKRDASIDKTELGNAAVHVPDLHAKYLTYLSNARLLYRKAQVDYTKSRQLRYKYYRGELSQEELTALGWDQYLLSTPVKSDMDRFLNVDPILIPKEDKVILLETLCEFLESVLKSIGSRGWDIKNAIQWLTWTSGQG